MKEILLVVALGVLSFPNSASAGETTTYKYDARGRLISSAHVGSVNDGVASTFQFDKADNRTSVRTTGCRSAVPGYAVDQFRSGTSGPDRLQGTAAGELFLMDAGGDDDVAGLGGLDTFFFGAAFTGADRVNGGEGADVLELQGDYAGGVTLHPDVRDLAALVLLSSTVRQCSFGGGAVSYSIKTTDANVAAGSQLKVDGSSLTSGERFTFDGSGESDAVLDIYGGFGPDALTGGASADKFVFLENGRFSPGDRVIGGAGYDVVYLRGNYSVDFNDEHMRGAFTGIESIGLMSSSNVQFATATSSPFVYSIVLNDGLLNPGQTLTINGSGLTSVERVVIDGRREASGLLRLFGGGGTDLLRGGGGPDLIFGGLGIDVLSGGSGADVFRFQTAAESTPSARDTIEDFSTGDLFDLSRIDANRNTPEDNGFSFIGSAPFSGAPGQLRAVPMAGTSTWYIQGDVNGDGSAEFEVAAVVIDGQAIDVVDFAL